MESLEAKIAVLSNSFDNLAGKLDEDSRVTDKIKTSVQAIEIAGAVAAAEARTYGPRLKAIEEWKAEQTGFFRAIFVIVGMLGALIGAIAGAIVTAWIKGKS